MEAEVDGAEMFLIGVQDSHTMPPLGTEDFTAFGQKKLQLVGGGGLLQLCRWDDTTLHTVPLDIARCL